MRQEFLDRKITKIHLIKEYQIMLKKIGSLDRKLYPYTLSFNAFWIEQYQIL